MKSKTYTVKRERYQEDAYYHLGDIDRSILGLLCYDA